MVSHSRTPKSAHQLRPIGEPRPVSVVTNDRNWPVQLLDRDQRQSITQIMDIWRIDDEWWRRPVSRMYYEVCLSSGHIRTIYHDLYDDRWYQQSY